MSYFDDNEDYIIYGRRRTGSSEPRSITCKRCGKTDLRWQDEDGEWVLMEGRFKVHKCDMQQAARDDFEVVE